MESKDQKQVPIFWEKNEPTPNAGNKKQPPNIDKVNVLPTPPPKPKTGQ